MFKTIKENFNTILNSYNYTKENTKSTNIELLHAADFYKLLKKFNVRLDDVSNAFKNGHVEKYMEKSSSNMIFSSDSKYIFKTINSAEVDTFSDISLNYFDYFLKNEHTYLAPIIGLFKIKTILSYKYLVLILNICNGLHPKQMYDLKGRMAKTKCMSCFALNNKISNDLDNKMDKSIDQDSLNLIRDEKKQSSDIITDIIDDNVMNTIFMINDNDHKKINPILERDMMFLKNNKLIDYSFFIGTYSGNTTDLQIKHLYDLYLTNNSPNVLQYYSNIPTNELSKLSKTFTADGKEKETGVDADSFYTIKIKDGSNESQIMNFMQIGIIDYLNKYTLKKKISNFFKSKIWNQNQIASINHVAYHTRFKNCIRELFKVFVFDDAYFPTENKN
jgi:hypothetical protein